MTRPVVFVHGLIGHLADPAVLNALKPRVAVAPDLLGYGTGPEVPSQTVDLPAQVAELDRVIHHAGWSRVHLVGHSVGAVICALFAAHNLERVAAFVNVEGNFTLADAFWSAKLARLPLDDAASCSRRTPPIPVGGRPGPGSRSTLEPFASPRVTCPSSRRRRYMRWRGRSSR